MGQTVLVIGGAGVQEISIMQALCSDPKYTVRILTRNHNSETAKELFTLPQRWHGYGTWVFWYPLREDAVPVVHFDDVGKAVKQILDTPEESAGLNVKISVQHASGDMLVEAFTQVTGQPARYKSISTEQWLIDTPPGPPGHKLGSQYEGNSRDDATLMTVGQNFTNW
ncbi:hypothetical protein K504DRAFT_501355 [Pleomassaria siparia CBS 279.74]|uniref:NmrA-like domain-containing protein n=1 Tax=Pleomassaria siparia CBS 279.74 TaxID=1314801 RepID=A0A6G1KC78_9PLEO|nr:hypothetical protein K504DRAFT_501355 [Pleomassaria siparia CBS 279.74]